MYACWQRTVFGADILGDKFWHFFFTVAKLQGLKNKDQFRRAWDRITVYFADALKTWQKDPNSIEPLAFLRASEEFWFDDGVQVEEKNAGLPDYFGVLGGVRAFYPREIDRNGDPSHGHGDRSRFIWHSRKQRANEECSNARETHSPATSVAQLEGWRWDHKEESQRESCAILGHPPTCVKKDHVESPRLLRDPPEPMLWEIANGPLPNEQQMLWHDDMGEDVFDFDEAIEDGLCEEEKVVESIDSPQAKMECSPSQPVEESPLDENMQTEQWKEARDETQKQQRDMRHDSGSEFQVPQPIVSTDGIERRDFADENTGSKNGSESADTHDHSEGIFAERQVVNSAGSA
jgi:hypothetical protein